MCSGNTATEEQIRNFCVFFFIKPGQKDFCHQVKPPEPPAGTFVKEFSLWVCVAPGDPSVSSYRLRGAEPAISTSPSHVLQKLPETMFILYVLMMGVYSFTVQPEEHRGEK